MRMSCFSPLLRFILGSVVEKAALCCCCCRTHPLAVQGNMGTFRSGEKASSNAVDGGFMFALIQARS